MKKSGMFENEGRVRLLRIGVLLFLILTAVLAVLSVRLFPDGLLVRLLHMTHATGETPAMYGPFHIGFFVLNFLLVVLITLFGRKIPKSSLDGIVFSAGVFLFLIELYKQLYYHVVLGNGHYNFSILPLQLCSYVLYLYLAVPLLPEGRVKNTLYLFAALYQTAGGAIVMGCPLFYPQIALSVHTMVWHTVMIGFGLLILFLRGYGVRYRKEILPAAAVFLAVYVFGMALNVLLAPLTENSAGPLNLFYLSPLEETHNIIIADVRRAIGWLPAVMTYAVLLTGVCVNAVWLFGFTVHWVTQRLEKRKHDGKGGRVCR